MFPDLFAAVDYRMEECPGAQQHTKGSLQDEEQSLCGTPIV